MKSWYQLRTISNGEPEIQLETSISIPRWDSSLASVRPRRCVPWCGAPLHGDILDRARSLVVSETLRTCFELPCHGWTTLPVDVPGPETEATVPSSLGRGRAHQLGPQRTGDT